MRIEKLALAALLSLAAIPAGAVVLTGKVSTQGAQPILAPPSLSTPVTLQFYVPDGTRVKQGEAVLRIDASSAASQLDDLKDQIALAKATNAATLASLQSAVYAARIALVNSIAARDTAKVDAAVPESLVTGINYDQYQGTYKSAIRDVVLKQKQLDAAQEAAARQVQSGDLSLKKLEDQLTFAQEQVEVATVYAQHAGTVVHAFKTSFISFGDDSNSDQGASYVQGSMVFPGTEVGEVIGAGGGQHTVQAWALQPDRRGLKVGQAVDVHFDALPQADVGGKITAISSATQPMRTWGDGQYYVVDIALDAAAEKLPLLPGMSVRVQTDPALDHKPVAEQSSDPTVLHATGEIIAQNTWDLIPPRLPDVWRMNITRMAPDGSTVRKGEPLATFAAGSLELQLPNTRSQLAEAERTREQLRMQLADDERTVKVNVAQAQGNANKAVREADQPKEFIPGNQYKKLVIARAQMEQILKLTQEQAKVLASSSAAQMAEADANVAQLERKVERMEHSLASLTVRAPRAGLFLHTVHSDGSKVDIGSSVFFGQTIGSMPDMKSLAVRAELPERDLRDVHVGQPVQVVLSGGSSLTLTGHIADIGRNVHSKSDAEPEPVVSIVVAFNGESTELRPGRSVRVDIPPAQGTES